MAAKLLFLLGFLIIQVSYGQNSLTFVIDDTFSMDIAIQQVKRAAKSIVDIVLGEKSSQIEDIVLVTFNDPGTLLRRRTRNENELKQALDSIIVGGGDDCPEMSLSGIKKGLEESRPGSYLYVFTDATAKDHNMFNEIITLCQEKQSQIVFVLTGHCIRRDEEKYYHQIAAASNGQVFDISKDEVGQVLEYVKETIKGERTVIASRLIQPNTWGDIKFYIDDQTEYAVVSASGRDVFLTVFVPDINTVTGVKIMWTDNAKVLKLVNFTPGTYMARVKGDSEVNIMVFGRTDFTFQHGFSTEVRTSLKATDSQPTTGINTHLVVSVQDKGSSADIREVELLDITDRVLLKLPLTRVAGDFYKTDKFLSPQNTFKIAVVATSKNSGKALKRIAKTPVTPIQSVAPEIYKTKKLVNVKESGSVDLHCRIYKGKPMPQIKWYVKKQGAAGFTQLSNTDDVIRVKNALTNDHYTCVAINVAGRDEHTLLIDVQAPPKFPNDHDVITKKEGEPATIDCKLDKGNPRPEVTWQFKSRDAASYKPMRHESDVLNIVAVELSHSGHYRCVANNAEGRDEKIVDLLVNAKPAVEKMTPIKLVTENTSVNLHCRAMKGFPKPTVNWFYKGPHSTKYESKNTDLLHIENVQLSDAGQYMCVAENEVGRHEQVLQLVVNAPPQFAITHHVIITTEGEPTTIYCKVHKGNPRPEVTWQFKPRGSASYESMEHDSDVLNMAATQLEHSGNYSCIANNSERRDEKRTELVVKVKPSVENLEPVKSVTENTAVNLTCRATKGFPKPAVNWFYKGPRSTKYESKNTDLLHIGNVQLSDAGQYMCVAENEVGRHEQVVQLVVNAPPKFPNNRDFLTKLVGQPTTIDCKLSKGNPRPEIKWQFKSRDATSYKPMGHESDVLYIAATQLNRSGHYRCVAKNAVGEDEKITELVVKAKPAAETLPPVQSVMENTTLNLHCRVTKGFPIPTVNWFYKGPRSTKYESNNTDHIHIGNVQLSDAGQYMCVAENEVGRHEQVVQLVVNVPPKFSKNRDVITKLEGKSTTIDCRVHKGNPSPNITWEFKPRGAAAFESMWHVNLLYIGRHRFVAEFNRSGHYRCVAKNAVGKDEKITELVVKVKPAVELLLPIQSVMENTTVNLHCSATKGFPKPTENWFYKGPHSTKYESKNTDHIHIGNVQLSDAGQYMCVAENEVGRHEQVLQLVVNAPPRIVSELPNSEYIGVEGDMAARLPCAAVGHPDPTITWEVDKRVISTDKSKDLYVEGNDLYLLHPKSADSTNKSHSYVCHAANEFGEAVQPYTVFIDPYIDLDEPNATRCSLVGQPFDVVCPLRYRDPSSVRWYRFNEVLNKTGHILHFDHGNTSYNGNYTCRVSDLTSRPISRTIELIFGEPPRKNKTFSDIEWTGQGKELILKLDNAPSPEVKYQWSYNGQQIEGEHSQTLNTSNWGEYTCQAINPIGSINFTWKIASLTKECGITKSLLKKDKAPLILDSSSSWLTSSSPGQYIIVQHEEKLQLACPEASNVTNGFTNFPTLKSVSAICDHEDFFLVNGVPQNISELDCKHSVTPSVMATGKTCLGENTELMRVGFHVNGFTDVFQSCMDQIKNVPLYTKINTIPIEDRDPSGRSGNRVPPVCLDDCCYEKIQLVNPEDVSFGPAENATFIDSLNSVNYCKPDNGTNWGDMEKKFREPVRYTVWSGAAQYRKVAGIWTPKYLWKVVLETETSERVVIVHANVETPIPKLCSGECGVKFTWFEPSGDRTYCCSLSDFKKAFWLTIDFDES